jgi:hypothetical protein
MESGRKNREREGKRGEREGKRTKIAKKVAL